MRTRGRLNAGRRPRAALGVLGFLLALAGDGSRAQEPAAARLPAFRASIDLVSLDVCVKRRDGRFVPGLSPDDFLVLEDNRPQRLEFFLPDGNVPLAVVLLIDRSSSMSGEKLARAKRAALSFIERLRPGDRVSVMSFNERANRDLALTTDLAAARRAVETIGAAGQTGLFEALLAASADLRAFERERPDEHRAAILVLSDGEDTSSRPTFEHVLEAIRSSGVLVYGVALRTDDDDGCAAPPFELLTLAHDTGGRAVAVTDPSMLTAVYEDIAVELRHLYRLGYVPADRDPNGGWRSISVRVHDRDLQIRTRSGYYAARAGRRGR